MTLPKKQKKELNKKTPKPVSEKIEPSAETQISNAEENGENQTPEMKIDWENFSLSKEVLKFEAGFISQALKETNGAVTKAALLLGLSHQHLSLLLKTRHEELATIKKPRKRRNDNNKKKKKRLRNKQQKNQG